MTLSIQGKTAIITGAANGVGLAIARHFIDRGANVMFADRDEARLADECGDIEDEKGQVRYFAGDLREKLTVANLLSATIDAFDRIDVLVNASRQILTTDPLDPTDGSVQTLLDQNMFAALQAQSGGGQPYDRAGRRSRIRGRARGFDREHLVDRGAAHAPGPSGLFDFLRRA
jgi:7-alpha-hydroxysteroid dehydrogenase